MRRVGRAAPLSCSPPDSLPRRSPPHRSALRHSAARYRLGRRRRLNRTAHSSARTPAGGAGSPAAAGSGGAATASGATPLSLPPRRRAPSIRSQAIMSLAIYEVPVTAPHTPNTLSGTVIQLTSSNQSAVPQGNETELAWRSHCPGPTMSFRAPRDPRPMCEVSSPRAVSPRLGTRPRARPLS